MNLRKNEQGLTVVEILISLAIATVFLTGVNQLLSVGIQASEVGRLRATAAQLASEGLEAMHNLRKNGGIVFESGWVGLNGPSEYYQPTFNTATSTWELGSERTTTPPPALSSPYNKYTRTVKVEPVRRFLLLGLLCSIGSVSDNGNCVDDNTRKVTITITWLERGIQRTYRTVSLLTNI